MFARSPTWPWVRKMSEILIRKATAQQAKVIAAFNQAMAMETEGTHLDDAVIIPGVKALLENPQYGFYLVAEIEQQPVACLLATFEWSDWRNGLFWWIQGVYVIKDFRRQGIYQRLYEHLKEMALSEGGICGFRLYAETGNQRAQDTYRNLGMEECPYRMFEQLMVKTEDNR